MSNGMIKEYDIRDVDVVRGLAGVVALELAPETQDCVVEYET